MKSKFKTIACIAALTMGVSAPALAEANCMLGNEIIQTSPSGQAPAPTETLSMPGSNWHALKRISNFERLNKACNTSVVFGHMPFASGAAAEVTQELDECSGASGDEITVGFSDNMVGGFITGLRITTSDQSNALNRRVKAMEVRVAMVTDACNLVQFEWSPHVAGVYDRLGVDYGPRVASPLTSYDARRRTDIVHDWSQCPRGYVATGVVLNRQWGGLSAVGLLCREVISRNV